jgi:hypothetical protein
MEKPPDQPRIGWAQTEARNLLREEEIFTPAVPIDDILEQYATIATFADSALSTFCYTHNSSWYVHLDAAQTPGELHYAEAIALGHLKLHHLDYNLAALTDLQLNSLNCEAYCFADCITMPIPWVVAACLHDRVKHASADTLAGLFSVSHAAMINRLHDLGLYASEDLQDWRQPCCQDKDSNALNYSLPETAEKDESFHH